MRSVPSLLLEDHCGSEMRHRLQVTKPEVGGPVGKQRNNSGERRMVAWTRAGAGDGEKLRV